MAELQPWFLTFDRAISLDARDCTRLRNQKRLLLRNLKEAMYEKYWPMPPFRVFTQGSFKLGTAVKPLIEDDIDIDLGIIFDMPIAAANPEQAKQWVKNALERPGRTVEMHRSCVRVQYRRGNENTHHVDLAIYGYGSLGDDRDLYIAKGYPGSDAYLKLWEPADPFQLQELFKTLFPCATDRAQFRRVIKYLKRWKDYNFRTGTFGKPTGIALTACAHSFFEPYRRSVRHPQFGDRVQYHDGHALAQVVLKIVDHFKRKRCKIQLPVEPYNDLFEKMTLNQMQAFKIELKRLYDAIISAMIDKRPGDAWLTLREVFGDEFFE